MSFRSDLVNALQAEATISAIVSDRITGILHTYEDQMNEAPNQFRFPAISVRKVSQEEEDNLDGHDGYQVGNFEIIIYDIVKQKRIRSRAATVRAAYEADISGLDTLEDAIKIFLHSKASGTIGNYHVRKSHISNSEESTLDTQDNRTIIIQTLDYEVNFDDN